MKSYTERLNKHLEDIKLSMFELIDNSRIKYFQNNDPSIVIIAPSTYWDEPTEKEQQIQIRLKKQYEQWFESFNLFTQNSPDSSKRDIQRVNKFVWDWIEKKGAWGIPKTLTEAKKKFEEEIKLFHNTLSIYSNSRDPEIILVPDTNALLMQPEPKNYGAIAGTEKFTLVFLPTVLSELDDLKMKSTNQDFQAKVKSVINRLKGYRQQGNLLEGVVVDKYIKLKMVAAEPDFSKTLTWLDRENNDDRIIASTLEIQKEYSSGIVSLVTADINLQNKAEMANISYLDIQS